MLKLGASSLAIALSLFWSSTVAAQETDSAAQDADSGVIIVTAERRSQRLSDVPAAISAVDGDDLQQRNLREVRDLEAISPNLAIRSSYGNAGNPVITIRGVGLADFNENNSSSAGVYVDEVYQVSPAQLGFGLFDIDRVELLKGPQGTLYGRNTTSGAINFISRQPTAQFEATGRLSSDNFDRFNAEVGAGGPLSETLSFRVATLVDVGGDYINNSFTGQRTGQRDLFTGRALLRWEPSSNFNITLNVHGGSDRSDIGHYQHIGLLDPDGSGNVCPTIIATGAPDGSCVDIVGYRDVDGDNQGGAYNRTGKADYRSFGASAIIRAELGGITLTSVTAFDGFDAVRPDDTDASPNRLLEVDYAFGIDQFSQEIRLNGGGGAIEWIAGGYYGRDVITSRNVYDLLGDFRPTTGFDLANGVFRAANPYRQATTALAAFGRVSWAFADRTKLEIGGRYSNERRTFRTSTVLEESTVDLANIGVGPDGVILDESRAIRNENLLWSVNLNHKTAGDTVLYARIGNGFKSGGFNGSPPLDPAEVVPYRPESLIAYEVGAKGSLFSRRLRYDLSGFYYDYTDLQVFTVVNTGGIPVQVLTNAANARIYGVEASLTAEIFDSLNLSLAAGLLSARYRDANIGGFDVSGQRLTNAPQVSATVGFDYRQPLGGVSLILGGNAKYQSREILDQYNFGNGLVVTTTQRPYWTVDGQIGLATRNDAIELSLFVRNLFDVRPLTGALGLPDFGLAEYSYGQQRRIGLALIGRF